MQEKEQRRASKGRGSHLISLVNIDEDIREICEEEAEVMATKILKVSSKTKSLNITLIYQKKIRFLII